MKARNEMYLKKRRTIFFEKWSILGYFDTLNSQFKVRSLKYMR